MTVAVVIRSCLGLLGIGTLFGLMGSCSAGGGDTNSGGTTGGGGSGGIAFGGNGGNGAMLGDGSTGDGMLDEAGACAGEKYPGKLAPLDIYVLLDATGSMNGGDGEPDVWTPTTQALIDIVSDKKSEGIGVGLTFLPVPPQPGVKIPGSCNVDADCPGTTGPCKALIIGMGKFCTHFCTTATVEQDCGIYGDCVFLPGYKWWYCNGASTPKVSCDPTDYGQPVVPIDVLPGNQAALTSAINGKSADGDATPTEPALRGALTYASQWATDHPSHITSVLIATDGEPNDCTGDSDVTKASNTAAEFFNGMPSIPTYVLGIGTVKDLDAIASAGGTSKAYMADGSTVAKQMVDMFNEIRANGACQLQIPVPTSGKPNYEAVNVTYVPLGETDAVTVGYVDDLSKCDAAKGGWYYDDPTKQNPKKIILCPATCKEVQLSIDGVNVLLGCKTVVY